MSTAVIDASVAAKWFLPATGESFADEAILLLQRYTSGDLRFLVPDLFWAEIGNLFWKAVRLGRYSAKSAQTALEALEKRAFPTVPSRLLLMDAYTIANAFDRTVYDALYVALAVRSKCHLITADERLANALAAYLPVKWLGAL